MVPFNVLNWKQVKTRTAYSGGGHSHSDRRGSHGKESHGKESHGKRSHGREAIEREAMESTTQNEHLIVLDCSAVSGIKARQGVIKLGFGIGFELIK